MSSYWCEPWPYAPQQNLSRLPGEFKFSLALGADQVYPFLPGAGGCSYPRLLDHGGVSIIIDSFHIFIPLKPTMRALDLFHVFSLFAFQSAHCKLRTGYCFVSSPVSSFNSFSNSFSPIFSRNRARDAKTVSASGDPSSWRIASAGK